MSCSILNVQAIPIAATWEIEEAWDIKVVADVSSSLNNKWFKAYAPNGIGYYWYYNVGGAGVDPAPAGLTLASDIAIAVNATAATVATATNTAIDAHAQFESVVDGDTVSAYALDVGDVPDWDNGTASPGFTFTQCQEGGSLELGELQGNVEFNTEEQTLEVRTHAGGTRLKAEIRQGNSVEVTLTMLETSAEKLKEIFAKAAGGTYTPMSGTELFGYGDSRQGKNTVPQARRLVLHPVKNSTSDYSEDVCVWKAYPMPDSLTFSGEELNTVEVVFKGYIDETKPTEIRLWSIGDWTQLVPIAP